ncbi:MAG: DNA ligase [Chitinophagales bacterium]|nr:MAG: DNA ligase [Chitinophagales bacterium]
MYTESQQRHLIQRTRQLLQRMAVPEGRQEAARLAADLREIIHFHDWRYYVLSDPAISDFEYDQLFKLLKQTEQQHPDLVTPDSPTQRVAYGLTKEFPQVSHLVPMLSLDNSYDEADLIEFDRRVKELTGVQQVEYCVEPKFDGASIAVIYENDLLKRAATRGDGAVGEEITNNIKVLRSLPLSAKFSSYGIYTAELRGEVIISKEHFNQINQKRLEEGLPVFINPRNTASGALRMQDAREVAGRGLEAFMYHLAYATDKEGKSVLIHKIKTHSNALELLYKLGFKSPYPVKKICANIQEVARYCEEWQTKRDDFPYEIDGMVVKVNAFRLQEKAGATSHHPRWAMAYKFKARQAVTRVNNIFFSVGRTGAITPVAQVEPVFLAGVTISNVSLFNEEILREKDIRIGDHVLIERAGDVIPYIVHALPEKRTGSEKIVHFPKHCPSCGSPVVKLPDETVVRCVNASCPAQVTGRIIHFVSASAMDIRGLGPSLVLKFYDAGLLKSIPDIYRLDYEKILQMPGFREKSVNNLKRAIEESKNRPLNRLIYGLGIRYVGEATAKTLMQAVEHLLEFKDWTVEQFEQLEDIGPKVAASLADFFHNPDNIRMLHELERLGVNLKSEKSTAHLSGKLAGKTFLFTGTLEHFSRSEAESLVEANGGKVAGSVNAKLNYLVVGAEPGSKLEKAKKLGTVHIISEQQFLDLLK